MHPQCNKGIKDRHKSAAMTEEGQDIRQDLRENHRAGDRKVNSQVIEWVIGSK
jgi:hypothetical protein